ncbi:MAG: hypothetical protein H3C62_12090 [Gemmatimonadaceae bacterium]|nr:hypothetical protein [Gemmatimonadaceae bacterium]
MSLAARQRVVRQYEQSFADIRRARHELWALAFGLDGWEAGHCQGWFPEMFTTPAWGRIADMGIRQHEHLALLIVDTAVTALLDGERSVTPEAAFALAMLASADGTFPPVAVQQRVEELIGEVAEQDERFPAKALTEALRPASVADLHGWERLARWMPFLDFADEAIGADALAQRLSDVQRRRLAPLLRSPQARQKIACIRIDGLGARCSACDTRLATQAQSVLLHGSDELSFCETCGRLLVMVDREAPISRAVLAADTTREKKRGVQS